MTLHPSRRTLLQTAAWGVPAVSLAAAAPAFASSNTVSCAVTHTFDFAPFEADTTHPGHPMAITNPTPDSLAGSPTFASWTVASTAVVSGGLKDSRATATSSKMTIETTAIVGRFRDSSSMNGATPNGHFRFTKLNQTATVSGNDPAPEMIASGPALKFATDTPLTASGVFPEMEIVLTFDTAVENLSFLLTDFDANGGSQLDKIWIKSVTRAGAPVPWNARRPTPTAGKAVAYSNDTGTSLATAWTGTSAVGDPENRGNLLVTTPAGSEVDRVVIGFANHAARTEARNNTINFANVSYTTRQNVCVPI